MRLSCYSNLTLCRGSPLCCVALGFGVCVVSVFVLALFVLCALFFLFCYLFVFVPPSFCLCLLLLLGVNTQHIVCYVYVCVVSFVCYVYLMFIYHLLRCVVFFL